MSQQSRTTRPSFAAIALYECSRFLLSLETGRGGRRWLRAGVENTFIAMLRAMLFPDQSSDVSNSSIVPGFVHRAERYIQQHLTEDIRLDHIVAAAGVPARTLHYGFRRFRSSTPMRWLRHKRFEQARLDLLAGARDGVQVIEIAHRYWMHHRGRFAINYQKLFGETPSATLRSALKGS